MKPASYEKHVGWGAAASSQSGGVRLIATWAVACVLLMACGQTSTMARSSASASPNANTAPVVDITIVDFAFQPSRVTVAVGTTVKWTNLGSTDFSGLQMGNADHNITFDSGTIPTSPDLPHLESYSIQFLAPGVYHYHCDIHDSMKGVITVVALK